jgi:hypothetical protein
MGRILEELLRPGQRANYLLGTVTATPGTGVVSVDIGGGSLTLPHLRGYAPAVNDTVVVLAQGERAVVLDAYTNPADPVPARNAGAPAPVPSQPKPKPPVVAKPVTVTRTFSATATGCFRGGKWRTDTSNQPHQGDWNGAFGRNTGAWFYGTQIAAALAGATVIKARMRLIRLDGGVYGSAAPTMSTHTSKSRPAGALSLSGATTLAGQAVGTSRWVDLPLSLGQALSNGSGYGLACNVAADDPYIVYAGLSDSRSSGALQITYRKV